SLEPQVYKHRISVSTHMPSQGLGFTVSLTAGTFELPQTRFSAPGPARPVQPSTAAGSIHTTSQVWPSRSSKARPYMKPWSWVSPVTDPPAATDRQSAV